jgi:hypothetical protein
MLDKKISDFTEKETFEDGDFLGGYSEGSPNENKRFSKDAVSDAVGSPVYESKTFLLNAAGESIAGSDAGITLINPGANPTIRVTTTKELKLGFFNTIKTSDTFGSDGKSDGTIQNCQVSLGASADDIIDQINCINVLDDGAGDGWTGAISAINPTSFDITLTQVGAGLDITGQMHLIEG